MNNLIVDAVILFSLSYSVVLLIVSIKKNKALKKELHDTRKKIISNSNLYLNEVNTLKSKHSKDISSLQNKHQEEIELLENNNAKKYNNMVEQYRNNELSLNSSLYKKEVEYNELNTCYNQLKTDFTLTSERYNRAKILHPNLDDEVDRMIHNEIVENNKKEAARIDDIISKVMTLPASKGNYRKFKSALYQYNNLTEDQKQYIASDITRLSSLYDESLKLKKEFDKKREEEQERKFNEIYRKAAADAEASIKLTIDGIDCGKEDNMAILEEAMNTYTSLNVNSLCYVDSEVVNRLNELFTEAKSDKENKEKQKNNFLIM